MLILIQLMVNRVRRDEARAADKAAPLALGAPRRLLRLVACSSERALEQPHERRLAVAVLAEQHDARAVEGLPGYLQSFTTAVEDAARHAAAAEISAAALARSASSFK